VPTAEAEKITNSRLGRAFGYFERGTDGGAAQIPGRARGAGGGGGGGRGG
jgi:hypothetical protein